jgi:pto-interacting protein 1
MSGDIMQAHTTPPDYFVLGNSTYKDDLYPRKSTRMRRWLCCTCQVEESYPSNENEHLKSPRSYGDGEFFLLLAVVYYLTKKQK